MYIILKVLYFFREFSSRHAFNLISTILISFQISKNSFPISGIQVVAEVTDENQNVKYLQLQEVESLIFFSFCVKYYYDNII